MCADPPAPTGEPGGDIYIRRNPDRTKQRALDQLKKLGYPTSP